MWFTFEQALRKKCEQNPDLSLLVSQWEYDRRLVADALQAVVRYFPHYSRHDASHSNTILVQIARVLGQERIDALSATDIWLLLEAAYQHDIGMVVTDEQVRTWWGDAGFRDFLAQLQYSPDLELRRAAGLLTTQPAPGDLPRDWPIEMSRALTLAVAEYARRHHATNADRIIREPERTIGLLSPRTHLIPARLFRLLGRICSHHGRSFEETMKLPLQESGLGTDDAHPRFVACMLRLGDLLDLDNGRFCPVMVRSFGTLPATSMAHFEKHAAINHLRVSPTRIEVEAECDSYETYEVTEQWLEWLRGEMKNQMAHWVDIAPSPKFGALPSLGEIQAHIRGYLTLEPGQRPRFEVDREQILTLVRGANIYGDHFAFIRELVQNAVDATLIRLWREQWSLKPREELEKLTPTDLRRALKEYPIRIGFQRVESDTASDRVRWRFYVEDQGTGISLDDIRYIQRIGSSSKNPDRQHTIREMPEWMRPSGTFGIGLQSAFLFTDKVVIKTRHHMSREALELTLQNGRGSGLDGLSIKHLENNEARLLAGTKIEFFINMERVPISLMTPARGGTLGTYRRFEFDPIIDTEFPYEAVFAEAIYHHFSGACACPIELEGAQSTGTTSADLFSGAYFDPETNLEIIIKAVLKNNTRRAKFHYRGAVVDYNARPLDLPLLHIKCNIHMGKADEILLASRENFTKAGEKKVLNKLNDAIDRYFPRYVSALCNANNADPDEIRAASMQAFLSGMEPSLTGDEWRSIHIGQDNTAQGWTMGMLASQSRVVLSINHYFDEDRIADIAQGPSDSEIKLQAHRGCLWLYRALWRMFSYCEYYGNNNEDSGVDTDVFVFSNQDKGAAVTEQGWRTIMNEITQIETSRLYRFAIPCPDAWLSLACAINTQIGILNVGYWRGSRMICPFVVDTRDRVTLPGLSRLVEWVVGHVKDGPRPESEIARGLWNFICMIDSLMEGRWEKAYDLKIAEHELRRWLK